MSQLIRDLNVLNSVILGLVYNLASIMMVIQAQLVFDSNIATWKRVIMAPFCITIFFTCYLVNYEASWMPTNIDQITYELYQVSFRPEHRYLRQDNRLLRQINTLVWSINQSFNGFYCFNLFPFKRISFYQFFLALGSIYILTHTNY